MNLKEIFLEISNRILEVFRQDAVGKRPVNGNKTIYHSDPHFKDLVL